MSGPPDSTPLDAANAAFIGCGVMVSVASRDANLAPSVVRALGCRVAPDRRRVTVLLAGSQSAALLRDLRDTRAIAVVFSQPSTHRTIQLKGSDALVGAPEPGDAALIEANCTALVRDMVPAGYPESFVRTLLAFEPHDLVAVTFAPSAAFAQTPGPHAGKRL